jgi:hypothetical protein
MGQEPKHAMLDELRTALEAGWPIRIAALRAAGVPVALYDDLSDDDLKATAKELGVNVAADADRETIAAAVKAAEDKRSAQKPPWGDDNNFDPARAWKLIQDTRADRDRLKSEVTELRTKVKEHEDATKSKEDLAAERATEAERVASESTKEAMRLRVALKKDLTETQALRLVGDTEEALEADADELLASFTHENDDDNGEDPLLRRPRPRLRSGAAPTPEPEETDPAKLAATVPRRY